MSLYIKKNKYNLYWLVIYFFLNPVFAIQPFSEGILELMTLSKVVYQGDVVTGRLKLKINENNSFLRLRANEWQGKIFLDYFYIVEQKKSKIDQEKKQIEIEMDLIIINYWETHLRKTLKWQEKIWNISIQLPRGVIQNTDVITIPRDWIVLDNIESTISQKQWMLFVTLLLIILFALYKKWKKYSIFKKRFFWWQKLSATPSLTRDQLYFIWQHQHIWRHLFTKFELQIEELINLLNDINYKREWSTDDWQKIHHLLIPFQGEIESD